MVRAPETVKEELERSDPVADPFLILLFSSPITLKVNFVLDSFALDFLYLSLGLGRCSVFPNSLLDRHPPAYPPPPAPTS